MSGERRVNGVSRRHSSRRRSQAPPPPSSLSHPRPKAPRCVVFWVAVVKGILHRGSFVFKIALKRETLAGGGGRYVLKKVCVPLFLLHACGGEWGGDDKRGKKHTHKKGARGEQG
jgi:hypothetical protein